MNHKYRVTLICKCQADYAEGYGPTPEVAKQNAYHFFHKDHGRHAKPAAEILEVTVTRPGGSLGYEEVQHNNTQRSES
jgi:hypothetical protein